MFNKILIANRGEIALRVIRACKELNVKSVVVYSQADKESLPVYMADEAYCIGPPPADQSYLNMNNIISTAQLSGCDAIHPGYGFLSENPIFGEMCSGSGLVFIGPDKESMVKMGNKSFARKTMIEAGVPVVPGSESVIEDKEHALRIAEDIGYPVLVKASAGGGGRGMRVAQCAEDLEHAVLTAQSEAQASFNNNKVYLEKYVEEPRHIEFQILGDGQGNAIHLGERDCSIQRRNQKIIEESPSTALNSRLRQKMGQLAVAATKAINYKGAGTVEFLLDNHSNYYFIEMNTRIQVEHPVTEMVTGVNLVKEQIKIAAGEAMLRKQEDIDLRGWSIECRINAEDPDRNFLPSPGTLTYYAPPGGPGVRVDSAAYTGWTVPSNYDSLIGKLIVWGEDREEAVSRMQRALDEYEIQGIKTNIPFHRRVLRNAFFRRGEIYTNFVQRRILPE
ncbi:MAG: acetyl-CoA carboxylase biotin carboxylase subunit [Clostridiales bacterium]|nr:acetyl-CoA carboxylase biotin carboxylase subunit [Clostridiales bacterium]MCF8022223.1 acetyl-CoA carboxylase biotin carboxylase subunit [Clostridiales bacterium]